MGIVYNDKVIVFKSDSVNAVKAKEECDSMTGTSVDVHDGVIVIKFWPCWQMKTDKRGIEDAFKKAQETLNKYDIPFKVKKFTF